jgi:hypothetical protein
MRGLEKRLARLEESVPLPLTAERFVACASQHARRSGVSTSSAMDTLVKGLSDSELDSLAAEFEQIVFGSDTAARDAAKREVLAAAGYPVWSGPRVEESRDEGW